MRTTARTGDLDLPATKGKNLLRVQVVEGYAVSRARGSRQLDRRAGGLGRAHDQLLGSRIRIRNRSNEADPLILRANALHRYGPATRLHGHPAPLVDPRLVPVVDQPGCRAGPLQGDVSASRVNLRVVGRSGAKLDAWKRGGDGVPTRNHSAVAPPAKNDLATTGIRIGGAPIGRVEHEVVAQQDRAFAVSIPIAPEYDVPVVGQEGTGGNRLHPAAALYQDIRSAQAGGKIRLEGYVASMDGNRTIDVDVGLDVHGGNRVILVEDEATKSGIVLDYQLPEVVRRVARKTEHTGGHLRDGPVPVQFAPHGAVRPTQEFRPEIGVVGLDLEHAGQRERGLSRPGTGLGTVEGNPVGLHGDRA